MEPDLSNVVLFEIPNGPAARGLLARLAPTWPGAVVDGGDVWTVLAELRPFQDDLALLLRAVQRWLVLVGFYAIRFQVDGRYYVLEARDPALTAAVA